MVSVGWDVVAAALSGFIGWWNQLKTKVSVCVCVSVCERAKRFPWFSSDTYQKESLQVAEIHLLAGQDPGQNPLPHLQPFLLIQLALERGDGEGDE